MTGSFLAACLTGNKESSRLFFQLWPVAHRENASESVFPAMTLVKPENLYRSDIDVTSGESHTISWFFQTLVDTPQAKVTPCHKKTCKTISEIILVRRWKTSQNNGSPGTSFSRKIEINSMQTTLHTIRERTVGRLWMDSVAGFVPL